MLLIPIILFAVTMILASGEDDALVQRIYTTMPALTALSNVTEVA